MGVLFEALYSSFDLEGISEWTIESNPRSATSEKLHFYREWGVNRISLGVQSFLGSSLKTLGRAHSAEDARQAILRARASGFDNLNLDLIFGIPGQSLELWGEELKEATSFDPQHLALYNLTIESNTEFGRRQALGKLTELPEEEAAGMFELAMDSCGSSGFQQYEISNYSLPGFECLHNLAYWRGKPYIGFGVSAASFFEGIRWKNTDDLASYCESVSMGQLPVANFEKLSPTEALGEAVMLLLRTSQGADLEQLSERFGIDAAAVYRETLEDFQQAGLIHAESGRIQLTREGRLFGDSVCVEFLSVP
jgi:oxygen-independent coproporphyrinogen-3 oxidase